MWLHSLLWAFKQWYDRKIVPPENERLMWDLVQIGTEQCKPGSKLTERWMIEVNKAYGVFTQPDGTMMELTITPEDGLQYRRERK